MMSEAVPLAVHHFSPSKSPNMFFVFFLFYPCYLPYSVNSFIAAMTTS